MTTAQVQANTYDVVIVGSGINGSLVAQLIHEQNPAASLVVLEGGRDITPSMGEHLINADENALDTAYEELMRRARQIEYVKGAVQMTELEDERWHPDLTGIFPIAFLGHNVAEFAGAAVAWNIGGMGVHWTAATPWPYAEEIPAFLPREQWDADLDTARRLLRTFVGPLTDNAFTLPLFDALRGAVPSTDPDRQFGYMPMAGISRSHGPVARTGPRDIAPFLFDEELDRAVLRAGELVTRVLVEGRRVSGVEARDVATGESAVYLGRHVLIAADALRTPQLLWASGIRPEALGLRLNEHATIDADVFVDPTYFGLTESDVPTPPRGEPFVGSYWSPSIGRERPAHGQLMERVLDDVGHVLGLSWYCATEIRRENRVEFSDTLSDALGLPHMTVHFSYSDNDLAEIERTREVQAAAARAVGASLALPAELLPPGASLHYTGTVRMGDTDDGRSVCDPDGRVWGFENLYVAGNGVIPTALTCNATLTGATLAVRTARALVAATISDVS